METRNPGKENLEEGEIVVSDGETESEDELESTNEILENISTESETEIEEELEEQNSTNEDDEERKRRNEEEIAKQFLTTEEESEVSVYKTPFQHVEPDYDYEEVMNYIQQSLTCGICHGLVTKPMCCGSCASLYCEECIDQLDEYFEQLNEINEEPVHPVCPYCRASPSFDKTVYVNKILGYVFAVCYICGKKIRNSDLSHHLDSCAGKITNCVICGTKDKREKVHNCLYIKCEHCQTSIKKNEVEDRGEETRRNVERSEQSDDPLRSKFDAVTTHLQICSEVMVPCEFCKHLKKRGSMLDHHRTWCPEFILSCEYCNLEVPRSNYNTHIISCPLAREECEICEQTYPKNGMHLCPCVICEQCRTIVQKPRYNEHIEKHCPNTEVICKECEDVFKRNESDEHYCINDEDLENIVTKLINNS